MDAVLVKIFATALALSQVTTAPDAVKTQFDRTQDQEQVTQLLRDGCAHIKKVFDIERINLDDLIATALDDTQSIAKESKVFRNINFVDLQAAYRQFCTDQKVAAPAVDVGDVIDAYDKATATLPDDSKLKDITLPSTSVLLDGEGKPFAEVSDRSQRRIWVPIAEIPKYVQQAFVAAEDQHFFEHKGIDERGLIRAFISNLATPGRLQGGSTITQQVVKNLLVGDERTYERKIREIILTERVEKTLSKAQILELYLNAVYFGRGSWGIEMAARTYFGKSAKALSLEEGALLAGLVKGPNYFNPYRHPIRAKERLAYVLKRLHQEAGIPVSFSGRELPKLPKLAPYNRSRRDIGYYFVDQISREIRSAGFEPLKTGAYTVRSTINQKLQRAVEQALQEGLSRYERNSGRAEFKAPEANLAKKIERINAKKADDDSNDRDTDQGQPAWRRALSQARLPLYDVHWEPAIVIGKTGGKRGGTWRVGLSDGRVMPLSLTGTAAKDTLELYDVVLVNVAAASRKRGGTYASLRARPTVQGEAIVIENKTGRILAMTGGFSYPLSQLNRATQARRQPGSTIKPLVYLAALGSGLQPNTLVRDEPLTLPPINVRHASQEDYWTPQNDGGGSSGPIPLRNALAFSRNLATVHLLTGGIEYKPEDSVNRLCDLAQEAQVYHQCDRFYSFVLGAQPVRPVDLAAFYAAIPNEGMRPAPYVVEAVEQDGRAIYRREPKLTQIQSVDRGSFYQLKTMMQGVLAHGTASAIANLSPYVAGKTGTTDDANDAWFVGFTNDVTVAVWVGYDNAKSRRTLGGGSTGGGVAVPIFEPIIQAVWAEAAPRAKLDGPSPEAKQQLRCYGGRRGGSPECYHRNAKGKVIDTQYVLLNQGSRQAKRIREEARLAPSIIGRVTASIPQPRDAPQAATDGSGGDDPIRYARPPVKQQLSDDGPSDDDLRGSSPKRDKASRARRQARANRDDEQQQKRATRRSKREARESRARARREARESRTRARRQARAARRPATQYNPWGSQWGWQQQQYRQSYYSWGGGWR